MQTIRRVLLTGLLLSGLLSGCGQTGPLYLPPPPPPPPNVIAS